MVRADAASRLPPHCRRRRRGVLGLVDPQRDLDLRAEHNSDRRSERLAAPDDRAAHQICRVARRPRAAASATRRRGRCSASRTECASRSRHFRLTRRARRGGAKIVWPPKPPSPPCPRRSGGAASAIVGRRGRRRRGQRSRRSAAPAPAIVASRLVAHGVERRCRGPGRRARRVRIAPGRGRRGRLRARPSRAHVPARDGPAHDTAQGRPARRDARRARAAAPAGSASPSRRRRCSATWPLLPAREATGTSAPRFELADAGRWTTPRGCASASPRGGSAEGAAPSIGLLTRASRRWRTFRLVLLYVNAAELLSVRLRDADAAA